jgi:hypothetical protein
MSKINLLIILLFLGTGCTKKLYPVKIVQNNIVSNPQTKLTYDSFMQHSKDNKLIVEEFDNGLHRKIEKSDYPIEVITLADNKLVSFATSNNQRVKEVMNRLPTISPVDFLIELKDIDGEIKVMNGIFPLDWVKRDQFSELFRLSEVDIKMPIISKLNGPPNGDIITEYTLKHEANYAIIPGISIGHNAVIMMDGYLKNISFPEGSYNNLRMIKEWYNSGKSKEDFKKI